MDRPGDREPLERCLEPRLDGRTAHRPDQACLREREVAESLQLPVAAGQGELDADRVAVGVKRSRAVRRTTGAPATAQSEGSRVSTVLMCTAPSVSFEPGF